MAVYKSKGIVLRSIRYGEADRILDLYTQDMGLVSAIAKGIRRIKSRFGGRLEPLSCVDFLAYEGRTLDTITQVEVLRSFHRVRESLTRLQAVGAMVAMVRVLSGGDEADRRVFNLLYHALDALEAHGENVKSIEAAFSLKLSSLAGYTPRLDFCVSCERDPTEGELYFAPPLGGVLCDDCSTVTEGAFPLLPNTLAALQSLIARPIKEAAVAGKLEESVRRLAYSHAIAHAPGDTGLASPARRTLHHLA
ncbi:MAG: DNA repair protein RecO [Rubrobacter sp.]|nr:DNA repair protein RecO [Rubrobacter sp.]